MKRIYSKFLFVSAAVFAMASAAVSAYALPGSQTDTVVSQKMPPLKDSVRVIVQRADSLRMEYFFSEAAGLYREAERILSAKAVMTNDSATTAGDLSEIGTTAENPHIVSPQDSLLLTEIDMKKTMADNGVSMMEYISSPIVVARHRFSKEDFYLYYPLQDKSWREVPNQLDSAKEDSFHNAVYIPEGSREIYFSAEDQDGIRNIYFTANKDSLWTLPALVDERLTSSGNEVFPMFSPDGKSLYFSSSGLYGMGGYDLYKSDWDEEQNCWGVPVNMGFPYSSPHNDFLYIDTEDGKYSIFASDRDCASDSVMVYVLEFDNMPLKKPLEDPGKAKELARLCPVDDPSMMNTGATVGGGIPDNIDTRKYMEKVSEVRALKDSVFTYGQTLDMLRSRLSDNSDMDIRDGIEKRIINMELRLPVLQDSLARASESLQKIEMEFLFNGVAIDPDKVMAQADREVVGASSNYAFTRLSYGDKISFKFEKPEKKFDYSFMILPEGRFAEDNTLPRGIVYQIQMCLLSRPATVRQLKGLSPVFWHKTSNGNYIYRAGLFRTYNDVLSNLNKVKRLGFKTAFIVAFSDGQQIPVQKARKIQSEVKPIFQVNIVPDGTDLPEIVMAAIRQNTTKDIAKKAEDGKTVFTVGPFDSEEDAEKLTALIKSAGINEVSYIKVGNLQTK